MPRYLVIACLSLPLWLCGCAAVNESSTMPQPGDPLGQLDDPDPDDPYFATSEPGAVPMDAAPTGSIYVPGQTPSLYVERSHFQVGDIISVELQESTKATKKGSTSLKKTSEFNLDPIGVPGGNLEIGGNEVKLNVDQQQKFEGDGSATQSNGFQGELTVAVMKVMRNNNLLVRGDKWMLINNGKEYIRLTGVIRAKDVGPDNTIKSSKIANARIEYSGTGSLANSQRQGWFADKLNDPDIWPF
ncbi:flagellar basal body L-ring protein FlgH [Marinobacter mangrovi]|uniref:flagellar basal body L-ring protein FlgH n=1 Tax=Marinobacter mangrovi TaxID=2803918 RepID=UPI00193348D9|nr:flagellar basal body L-ring protein FlgH [Marinobacter mangrovi]